MSADGFLRIPRRLAQSDTSTERIAALLWIVSQASYAPREKDGVHLSIGETPCIPASKFEARYGWSRKTVRVFLEWATSDRCVAETGVRIRVGQRWRGPDQGPGLGPAKGPTYLVSLPKVKCGEGPDQGPGLGPAKGPTGLEEGEKKVDKKEEDSPPTGESAERGNRVVRKRATPAPMTKDWQPNEKNAARAVEWGLDAPRLLDDFRDYWIERGARRADWDSTFRNRMTECAERGWFLVNRSNTNGKGQRGADWRQRGGDDSDLDDPLFVRSGGGRAS